MLGRTVADAIAERGPDALAAGELVAVAREADLFVLNLECCISARGERRREPGKPFFFRAPPEASRLLQRLGVDCVTRTCRGSRQDVLWCPYTPTTATVVCQGSPSRSVAVS